MSNRDRPNVAATLREYSAASLGDRRLDRRLSAIAQQLVAAPAASFPELMDEAQLEATYRFFGNESVSHVDILEAHCAATLERVARHRCVRIVHDTTAFSFGGERSGLGLIEKGTQGFFAHMALVLSANESREPLGVLGLRPHIRKDTQARRKKTRNEQKRLVEQLPREEKHSRRWEDLAGHVAGRLPQGVQGIHVMDQEADDFAVLAALKESGISFVIRGSSRRLTKKDGPSIGEVVAANPATLFRSVRLNSRPQKRATRRHPPRAERDAKLQVRWAPLTVRRPALAQTETQEVSLWAVQVFEPDPPHGEERVEWLLLISEPVSSMEDAATVVDHYRARWCIEEYFKALKTGCSFEKRQLTTYAGLLRALAIFIPIAWQIYAVRAMSRLESPPAASLLFSDIQIQLLESLVMERKKRAVPVHTVRDVLMGIATLGGHLPRNGPPGWIVIWRGFEKFKMAEVGWLLAHGRSDQS